ncbi:MAG: hypothetical protein ABIU63_09600 [Chitinophagaceae bacterium]
MKAKTATATQTFSRSLAMGVLLSMVIFYGLHVFGTWQKEDYRRDTQTTSTVLLHNTCAILGKTHTLRPNTDISSLGDGIDGTKLSGSFMNFTDGHVVAMMLCSLFSGSLIYALRYSIKKRR